MASNKICYVLSLMALLPSVLSRSPKPADEPAENSTEPSFDLNPPDVREYTLEDRYVQFFENDPNWYHGWTFMSKAFREYGDAPLKKLCESAHFRAGKGMAIIHAASMNMSTLRFKNANYSPMKIDVITYDIKDYGFYNDTDTEGNRFYVGEGVRSDCVFYLTPANADKTEFYLDTHVCGLIIE